MGILDFFRSKQPEVAVTPQPLEINVPVTDMRLAQRLDRLYAWFEQKPNAAAEKKRQMRQALATHKYALAGRGHPLCEDRKTVQRLIAKMTEV